MSTRKWLWRTAGLMSLVYLAYVALVAYVVGTLSVELFGVFNRPTEDPALALGLFLGLPMIVSALLVGLLIASPLVTWFIALTVGLWRARRWAAVGGAITFPILASGGVLVVQAFDAHPLARLILAVLLVGPSLTAMLLLASGHRTAASLATQLQAAAVARFVGS